MADCCVASSSSSNEGLKELLKPFYNRASDAEERLSRLETVLSTTNKGGAAEVKDEESLAKVKELESKLEEVTKELAAERGKVAKLNDELNKKSYQRLHLVRNLQEAESKLAKLKVK